MTTSEVFGFEVCPGVLGSRALQCAVKRHRLSYTLVYRIGRTPVYLVMGGWEECKSYIKAEMGLDLDNPPDFGSQMPCGMVTPRPLYEALCFVISQMR